MRVLLDESVPRGLAAAIIGHDVTTVVDLGWAGTRNGDLLRLAAVEFDVFVTVDKNLPQQQDLGRYAIAVIVLDTRTNRLEDVSQLIPQLLDILHGPLSSPMVVSADSERGKP